MTPIDEQLKREIAEIVAEIAEVGVGEVTDDAQLEALGVDSLDGLRIVAAVERKYEVVIDEDEIPAIRTMPDIFTLVRRYASKVK